MTTGKGAIRMPPHDITVYGTVKVGERGQVVIPSDARKELEIRPGDFLLVIGTPMRDGVAMIRADAVKELVSKISLGLSEADGEGKSVSGRKREMRR